MQKLRFKAVKRFALKQQSLLIPRTMFFTLPNPPRPWSASVTVTRRRALHRGKKGRKEGKSAVALTPPEFQNTLNYFLTAHYFVLSILCYDHGDLDCTSAYIHVSAGLLSLPSEPRLKPSNSSLNLRNTEILFLNQEGLSWLCG